MNKTRKKMKKRSSSQTTLVGGIVFTVLGGMVTALLLLVTSHQEREAAASPLWLVDASLTIVPQIPTPDAGPAHFYCSKQTDAGMREVDLGAPPPFDPNAPRDCVDRRIMRGLPMWQWTARCMLWLEGEYKWSADAGVKVISQ